jgi:hypothetical protein
MMISCSTVLSQVRQESDGHPDFANNPYDPCVANKMIEGEQMTICFHVDDCKLSHRKGHGSYDRAHPSRVKVSSRTDPAQMTVSRGMVHMVSDDLNYPSVVKSRSPCSTHKEEIIAAFDKQNQRRGTKSSAARRILSVDEDWAKKPRQSKAVETYNLVARSSTPPSEQDQTPVRPSHSYD